MERLTDVKALTKCIKIENGKVWFNAYELCILAVPTGHHEFVKGGDLIAKEAISRLLNPRYKTPKIPLFDKESKYKDEKGVLFVTVKPALFLVEDSLRIVNSILSTEYGCAKLFRSSRLEIFKDFASKLEG